MHFNLYINTTVLTFQSFLVEAGKDARASVSSTQLTVRKSQIISSPVDWQLLVEHRGDWNKQVFTDYEHVEMNSKKQLFDSTT